MYRNLKSGLCDQFFLPASFKTFYPSQLMVAESSNFYVILVSLSESSTCQATAEDGSDEHFPVSSLPVTVCQADPKIMEQHAGMMECEVTTCKENAKKSGKRKISESNSEEGTCTVM